ncbi:MAG TPA: FAD-binding oxidoreductase [Candidatus Acidoferrum sp.]|nr:FAD-binding oxidoreductase [Candidatus Acidoferrum sp.]
MPSTPNWGTPPWKISFRSKLTRLPSHVDFAIVGAGFTGLAAAASLKRLAKNKSVLLLEAKRLGNGASGRTGGLALAETAAGNLPALGDVLKNYKQILRTLRVNAALDLRGVWEIAHGNRSMDGKKIKPLPNSPIDWSDSGRLRAVKKVPGGTIDPGKVVDGLARAAVRAGAAIAENAEVTRIDPGNPIRLHVTWRHRGRAIRKLITANRVLVSTNAASLHLAGNFLRSRFHAQPKLTFALATAPLTKKQIAALGMASRRPFYTVDLPYLWGRLFRDKSKNGSTSDRLIFGSGLVPAFEDSLPKRSARKLWSGLESENVRRGLSSQRLKTLEHRVRAFHPTLKNIRITHRWGGPILLTGNFTPFFRAHPKNKNIILLGGYSGHGVALSVHLAQRAAESLASNRKLPNWT